MSTVHRVALAQIAPVLADRQRNVALHLEQIAAARKQDADLIVFPELSLTGYFVRFWGPANGAVVEVDWSTSTDKGVLMVTISGAPSPAPVGQQ